MSTNQNQAEEQFRRMTETPVGKLILGLSIPTIISMMVTNIYNMADTYFVGTIGTSASGATGVVFGLMAIFQAFGFMFGHGAGSNISRRLGSKNIREAREFSSTSFYLSILAGLIFMAVGLIWMDPLMTLLGSTDTILPYSRTYAFYILIAGPAMTSSCVMNNILRYEGKAFYAMIGLTAGGILNIFGDAYFVRVCGLGIAGAGLSTTISQYISMGILLIPYLQKKTQSSFSIRYFTHRFSVVETIVKDGLPSLARQGLNSVSTMVLNNYAGIYGDAAIAAISICTRLVNFLFCIAIGIGQGFQPVSGFNFGAKLYSRVKAGFDYALKSGFVIMLGLGVLGYLNAEPLVRIFRDDPEVTAIGRIALRWQCLSLWLMPMSMYGNMLFQSIGISKTATFLASLRSGIVLIPVIIIFTSCFGLSGLEIAQAVSEAISSLITLPFVWSFFHHLPPDDCEYS
ncbi:MATE family efflux transporter [Stecheria intestinalis]|uniref:MATE family efflux transporter n=1 Tax=Stecheria intestinalis TaxID=2606630 RepID=UPI0023F477FC|nr:MATE family efflux transporter [Stecheria intestinalis]MDD5881794.1 MATE family efflux transporter [Stecheria intestinalis]